MSIGAIGTASTKYLPAVVEKAATGISTVAKGGTPVLATAKNCTDLVVFSQNSTKIAESAGEAIQKAKTPTAKIVAGITAGLVAIGLIAKTVSDKQQQQQEA